MLKITEKFKIGPGKNTIATWWGGDKCYEVKKRSQIHPEEPDLIKMPWWFDHAVELYRRKSQLTGLIGDDARQCWAAVVWGRRRQRSQAAGCPGNAQEHKYPAVWAAARTTSRTHLHSSRLLIDEFNLYAKRQAPSQCRTAAPTPGGPSPHRSPPPPPLVSPLPAAGSAVMLLLLRNVDGPSSYNGTLVAALLTQRPRSRRPIGNLPSAYAIQRQPECVCAERKKSHNSVFSRIFNSGACRSAARQPPSACVSSRLHTSVRRLWLNNPKELSFSGELLINWIIIIKVLLKRLAWYWSFQNKMRGCQ